MLEKYVATKLTDIVSVVADHKNLVRVCVLHALTAVCLESAELWLDSAHIRTAVGHTWISEDDN